jgi:hypothetical protein
MNENTFIHLMKVIIVAYIIVTMYAWAVNWPLGLVMTEFIILFFWNTEPPNFEQIIQSKNGVYSFPLDDYSQEEIK